MKKLLAVLFLAFFALNLACHSTTHKANNNGSSKSAGESTTDAVSDSWITAKAKLALIADKRTSGFATDVDAREGMVTLSGKVDTADAKTAATEVAKGIKGVKSVDNQLQVVPDAKRQEVNAADDRIEGAIKDTLKNDPKLKDLSLSAKSNAGVVTLNGSVDKESQLVSAAQAVRKVTGVKSVDSQQVTVKSMS